MQIDLNKNGRVNASCEVELPVRASAAWGQMRDIARFLTTDPLHARVRIQPWSSGPTPAGAALILEHRFLGIGPDRIGRVLRWRENRCLAISDLSQRGVRKGFPHICRFDLEPINDRACRMTIAAYGRWTARWWPRWAVKLWLWWVLACTARCVSREFNQYRRWLDARGPAP